ncbi:hypothetical protein KM043_006801 [Ampulex compressa]|nr:hypothetical protein KM043_006801 [Ampulex compressa]
MRSTAGGGARRIPVGRPLKGRKKSQKGYCTGLCAGLQIDGWMLSHLRHPRLPWSCFELSASTALDRADRSAARLRESWIRPVGESLRNRAARLSPRRVNRLIARIIVVFGMIDLPAGVAGKAALLREWKGRSVWETDRYARWRKRTAERRRNGEYRGHIGSNSGSQQPPYRYYGAVGQAVAFTTELE